MSIILDEEHDEQLNVLDNDVRWLHNNYDNLLKEHNDEFVAIKKENVIGYDKDLEKLKEKLKEAGIKPSEVLVDFMRQKKADTLSFLVYCRLQRYY
jgi:Family of unknown function (DUF5678)